MFRALLLLAFVQAGAARAGGTLAAPDAPSPSIIPRSTAPYDAALLKLPLSYQIGERPEIKTFSTQEFRPRGRSLLERDAGLGAADDAPMIHGTTVWQRFRDFRTRDRVRVVTLWETGASSVSLQAGKKGDPSLQWTSRSMNRGGATRGLLDEFLNKSLGGMSRGLHASH